MSTATPASVERTFDAHVAEDYSDETFDRIEANWALAQADQRASLLLEAFLTLDSAQYHGRRIDKGGLAFDLLARIDALPRPGSITARIAAREAQQATDDAEFVRWDQAEADEVAAVDAEADWPTEDSRLAPLREYHAEVQANLRGDES